MSLIDAKQLDSIHHVALQVSDVTSALAWYKTNFHCESTYEDQTWALVQFANIRLALVTQGHHPPHIAFERENASSFGSLETHRDGTQSVYIRDPSGNAVEIMARVSNLHLAAK